MLLKSLLKQTVLPLAIVLLNQNNALALDIFKELGHSNLSASIPDIIIDTAPNPSTSPTTQPPSTTPTSNFNEPRFTCELANGQYTVMYYPESRPNQPYPWAVPGRMGGGWTPEKRCLEISRRLEAYRPDGLLELNIGRENNYDILCATTERDPRCRIILTIPLGQDPEMTRNLVFENLLIADSGEQTYGITTFNGRGTNGLTNQLGRILNPNLRKKNSSSPSPRGGINLKPFLDPADGGTATQLKSL
jgi:hypothetical protein